MPSGPCPEALLQAPAWLPGGHLQTLWPALWGVRGLRRHPCRRWRELWTAPDGDVIAADWIEPPQGRRPDGAVVVLFHGLEGSSRSHYAQALAEAVLERGQALVVPHFRGCGGVEHRAPRAYHAGDHVEIDWMLARVAALAPAAVWAMGVSLGGNALLRWGQEVGGGSRHRVKALAAICAPLDLRACARALEQGVGRWIYTPSFLRSMKPKARRLHARFPQRFDLRDVLRSRTLAEFDDRFTAPLHGFADVQDYWDRASSAPGLRQLSWPALLLNPLNDPFVPHLSLPTAAQVAPSVSLWRPAQGGHVGLLDPDGFGRMERWPRLVLQWFEEAPWMTS